MYEYINYFCAQKTDTAFPPAQYFRSFSFLPIFPIFLPPPFPPSIFHGSFLCAEESPALVSTGNINFPRRGRSPSALWTAGRYSFRTVFECENAFQVVRHRYSPPANPRFVVETFTIRPNDSSKFACFEGTSDQRL